MARPRGPMSPSPDQLGTRARASAELCVKQQRWKELSQLSGGGQAVSLSGLDLQVEQMIQRCCLKAINSEKCRMDRAGVEPATYGFSVRRSTS
jgi:hypothetical protein